jgi:hypothetical protein
VRDAFIMLKTDIEHELLPTDRAISIGLIVNELVTNAVKYGFPGEAKGTVMVTLKRVPGELRLTVADDRQGLDPQRADSGLGGRLVDGFAEKLGGQVDRKSDSQGTAVHLISVPMPDVDRILRILLRPSFLLIAANSKQRMKARPNSSSKTSSGRPRAAINAPSLPCASGSFGNCLNKSLWNLISGGQ